MRARRDIPAVAWFPVLSTVKPIYVQAAPEAGFSQAIVILPVAKDIFAQCGCYSGSPYFALA